MKNKKEEALNMRLRNKSYNEIGKTLGIAKSTLSGWFKNNQQSQRIKTALSGAENPRVAERIKNFVTANKLKWERWRIEARERAVKEFKLFSKNPTFIAGTMLYWAEGDSKPKNPLRLTNTDPRMVKLYIKFLTKILKVPARSIRIALILYPDLSSEKAVNFWSKITGIPRLQFYKTQFIKGRHPTKRLSNGICMVYLNSGHLKEKILVWIDLLSKKL